MESRQCRISQGVLDAPPPPLAGALAAWLMRDGWQVRVVDPRGGRCDWAGQGPLWVHLDNNFRSSRLDGLQGQQEMYLFGPAVSTPSHRTMISQQFPQGQIIDGDPEPSEQRIEDLSELPLTTYTGFGPQPGGLFRILAGRGDRSRPIAHLCREIVYLVETFSAGHLLFDDEDLGAYPGWLESLQSELRQLPWPLTWEGTIRGRRIQGEGRSSPA